jgi:hypothetical protein
MRSLAVTTPLNWEATEAVVEKESVAISVCEEEPPADTDAETVTELDALRGEDGNARVVEPETVTLPEDDPVTVPEALPDVTTGPDALDVVIGPDALGVTEAVVITESDPESV